MIILALFLALILVDIALRLYLMSLTALQGRQAFLDKQKEATEGRSPEDKKKQQKRKNKRRVVAAAAVAAKRAAKVATRFVVKSTIRIIKWVLRLIQTIINALAALIGGWVLALIFVVALLAGLIGFILVTPDFGISNGPQSGSRTSTSKPKASSTSSGSVNCDADITGLDPEFWKKGDAMGQQVACNALKIIQKPPSGGLHYSQGFGLPPGYFDCVRFTGMSIAMTGYHQKGVKDAIPDYTKVKQEDTQYGSSTGGLLAKLSGHPMSAGQVHSSESLLPGDILITSGHAVVYLGKGTDGKDYLAHAGRVGASGSTTVAKAVAGDSNASDVVVTADYGHIGKGPQVLRPSLVKKHVDGGGAPLNFGY